MSVEQQAAYHEAGHCLIAFLCGVEAAAFLKGSGGGRCKTSITIGADDNPEHRAIREALINIAGLTCEAAFGRWDESAAKADLLALRTNYETLILLKSKWVGKDFETFRLMVSSAAGVLVRRHADQIKALASDLKAFDCGINADDLWGLCGEIPRDLAGKRWELAYSALLSEGASALEARIASRDVAEKAKGVLAYGIAAGK